MEVEDISTQWSLYEAEHHQIETLHPIHMFSILIRWKETNPNHFFRFFKDAGGRGRDWQCKHKRLKLDGTVEVCNYNPKNYSYYPPEECSNPESAGFVGKCQGRKSDYVLVNDPYRNPWNVWRQFDANLTALVKNGKITEIVVENGGSMYVSSDIQVSGSGSRVDVVQFTTSMVSILMLSMMTLILKI